MLLQKTLRSPVKIKGIGLHSGKDITVKISPAAVGEGITFIRTDLDGELPRIRAGYEHVVDTRMATTLGNGKCQIATVEHLMAAFHGMGVDNAVVEVSGPELPIMDGSSFVFCEAIETAGTQYQRKGRPVLAIKRNVELKQGDKWALAEPSPFFEVHASIEWNHSLIGFQEFHYYEGKTSFMEVAGARTFGFVKEIEQLKRLGLARGGSLENAVVLDESRVLNPGGLRYADEFVRHKLLDAIGDFALGGYVLQGRFRLHRPGHDLHFKLLQAILEDSRNYDIVPAMAVAEEYHFSDEVDFDLNAAVAV